MDKSEFIGEVYTKPNYLMYDLGGFPGLVKSDSGMQIYGELYEVSDELVRQLDIIEASPYLYKRESIDIEGHEAVSYLYQRETDGFETCGNCWNGDDFDE